MRILLTEDNMELADLTALNLKKDGFAVDVAYSGEEATDLLEDDGKYDAIVLDLNLPDIDGMELLKKLKSAAVDVPILALTCRDAEEDRVRGIEAGFDDYMTKPFSHSELIARLRILCRLQPPRSSEAIEVGPLKIHPENQRVLVDGVSAKLTLNEFRLLHYLVKNRRKPISKKELLESVWDMNSSTGSAKLVTTISRLREKIRDYRKTIIRTCEDGYTII